MTQILDPTKHLLLFTDKDGHNDTKEELFNSLEFFRQKPTAEINETGEAIVEVRPAKDSVDFQMV
jgi:hypothetical protein